MKRDLRLHPRDFVWVKTEVPEGVPVELALAVPSLIERRRVRIPEYMHEHIVGYLTEGILADEFLEAIVTNNLEKAFRCADATNKPLIEAYIGYFYNDTPSPCWGSPDKVRAWIESFRAPEPAGPASAPSVNEAGGPTTE